MALKFIMMSILLLWLLTSVSDVSAFQPLIASNHRVSRQRCPSDHHHVSLITRRDSNGPKGEHENPRILFEGQDNNSILSLLSRAMVKVTALRTAPSTLSFVGSAGLVVALCLLSNSVALASVTEDGEGVTSPPMPPSVIIQACVRNPPGTPTNCVSTANVRQYDLYSPPWTYPSSVSATEALARMKGAIQSVYGSDVINLSSDDTNLSIHAKVKRNLVVLDQLDFVIIPKDHVVTFSAQEVPSTSSGPRVSDFGALRQRLDQIRQVAGIFGVMGDALQDTADGSESSYYESLKQDQGPLGQLKAFYGLQSGEGFEDVFDD